MASGLPVISFNFHAGIEEIITKNYDGILVEEGNTLTMAEAIDYLISNEAERNRLGKNAKGIRNRLDPQIILYDKGFE